MGLMGGWGSAISDAFNSSALGSLASAGSSLLHGDLDGALNDYRDAVSSGLTLDPFSLAAVGTAQFAANLYQRSPDLVHLTLDVAGMIPIVGAVADLANAGLYVAERDWENAALSAAAAVPGLGYMAVSARYAMKGAKVAEASYRVAQTARIAGALDIGVNLGASGYFVGKGVATGSASTAALGVLGGALNVGVWNKVVGEGEVSKSVPSATKATTRGLGGSQGHGYARQVSEGGSGRAFAGHGELRPGSGSVVVPDGTAITLPRSGVGISDKTGRLIEVGDWDALAAAARSDPRVARDLEGWATYLPGAQVPNYVLKAPTRLSVFSRSTTVEDATYLETLLDPNMGVCDWAACTIFKKG